jgi:hypothetical protein
MEDRRRSRPSGGRGFSKRRKVHKHLKIRRGMTNWRNISFAVPDNFLSGSGSVLYYDIAPEPGHCTKFRSSVISPSFLADSRPIRVFLLLSPLRPSANLEDSRSGVDSQPKPGEMPDFKTTPWGRTVWCATQVSTTPTIYYKYIPCVDAGVVFSY